MSGFNFTPDPNALRAAVNSTYNAPGQPGGSIAGLQGARGPGTAGVGGGPFSGGGLTASSMAPTYPPAGQTGPGAVNQQMQIQQNAANAYASQGSVDHGTSVEPANPSFYGR